MTAARIFVSIASYCDSDCAHTVADLFEKAVDPARVFVGICWQYDASGERCPVPEARANQVRQFAVPADQSRGTGWARSIAFGLNDGEEYVLSIDAHMRFEPGWDESLIAALDQCPTPRAILTAILPNYERGGFYLENPDAIFRIVVTGLSDPASPQLIELGGAREEQPGLFDRPFASASIVGNFVFARRTAFEEVPIDPHIYFNGEEVWHSARFWTSGYHVYQPHFRVAYHRWFTRAPYKSRRDAFTERARQRIRHGLGLERAVDCEALVDISRFGLGEVRTVQEYFDFFGVDLREQTIRPTARSGYWDHGLGPRDPRAILGAFVATSLRHRLHT